MLLKSTLLVALLSASAAFAATTTMFYYDDHADSAVWNLPAADDYYVQGYDPADFDVTSAYTITEVGIWTTAENAGADGSGLCTVFLLYLPTKESSPDGVPEEYNSPDMDLYWYVAGDELNTHTVNWDVPAGQCLGLGVIGQSPAWIDEFILRMDSGPSDTADWEYFQGVWLDLESDEGQEKDFAYQLVVDHTSAIESASFGSIKATFK